jgi:PKD repeat protein/uncharacterized protein YxeA
MKKVIFVKLVVVTILMGVLATGSVSVDENSSFIEKDYFSGEFVKGKVNLSFSSEKNKGFTSNFEGGGKKILELLKEMGYERSKNYSCDPLDCMSDYEVDSIFSSGENVSLEISSKIIFGFDVRDEDVEEILDFKFDFETDAGEDCKNQIAIDILDDGSADYFNTNYLDESCREKDYGCFKEGGNISKVKIEHETENGFDPYCEKIGLLPPAPAYRLGADIEIGLNPDGDLGFTLYDIHENGMGTHLGGCTVIKPTADGNINCTMFKQGGSTEVYSSDKSLDAYVCIRGVGRRSDYKIKMRRGENVCGGTKNPSKESIVLTEDYEIFAVPLKYGPVGKITFNDGFYKSLHGGGKNDLTELVDNYVKTKFGYRCSDGCPIPFSIAGKKQLITLSKGEVKYDKKHGDDIVKIFQRMTDAPFAISFGFLIFDVEKMGIVIPNVDGTRDFDLKFDGSKIFSQEVDIFAGFDFVISPRFALVGRETEFKVVSEDEISSSKWDFGDGTFILETSGGRASHTYYNSSKYTVKVTLRNFVGKESIKEFSVVSGEAKISVNKTIGEYEERIADVEEDIKDFEEWVKNDVGRTIGLETMRKTLDRLKVSFSLATTEEEYVRIANELFNLEVPHSIGVSGRGELPTIVGVNNLDVETIKEISGGVASSDVEKIKNAIIYWQNNNYDPKVEFEKVVAIFDSGESIVLTKYDVRLNKKLATGKEDAFLVIKYPGESLDFKSSYAHTTSKNGNSVRIKVNGLDEVSFSIYGERAPSVAELGIYISPVLEKLQIIEINSEIIKKIFNWKRFLIGLLIVVVIVFGIYIILQTWYKRRYERHLFKNPNDLYNLINFIYNSRRGGLKDKETKNRLLSSKWKREQITYAFKKLEGKRTGMWEIPLFRFIEKRKIKKEIQKKNPNANVEERFIKRPHLLEE